ncbi:MAG: hypothetical protein HS104_18475 [Polyangiaceae bacterium]|nr:hypothetical protein [Polyangiaceae bacterium]
MQRFAFTFLASFAISACGGVSIESPPEPAPVPGPPAPSPLPQAKSLVCPGAPIDHADDVLFWHQAEAGVMFVRHDGSSLLAHAHSPETPGFNAEVAAGGDRIALAAYTAVSAPNSIELFDRRGSKLAERAFMGGIVTGLFVADDGRVVFSVQAGTSNEGFIWDGGEPKSLGSWIPIGPVRDGWVPARKSWETNTTTAFVHESGSTKVFHSGSDQVWRAGSRLARVDGPTRELWLGSPSGTAHVPLGAFGAEDAEPPHVAQARDEGFVLIRRSEWLKADVLVVNVDDQSVRFVPPAEPGIDDELSFYCNAGWPGYLASDGSVLTSRIEGGQLRVWKRAADGEHPLGLPLASIAVLGLVERAGTTAILGSDGSDTYCGTPGEIWQSPAPKGAIVGDSLQFVRNPAEPRLGEFSSSFNEPSIDESGHCVLASSYDSGAWTARLQDIDSGAVFSLPSGTGIANFIR